MTDETYYLWVFGLSGAVRRLVVTSDGLFTSLHDYGKKGFVFDAVSQHAVTEAVVEMLERVKVTSELSPEYEEIHDGVCKSIYRLLEGLDLTLAAIMQHPDLFPRALAAFEFAVGNLRQDDALLMQMRKNVASKAS